MPDLSDTIQEVAETGIQSAAVDGRSSTGIPLPDLIQADKYLADKAAQATAVTGSRSAWGGTRMARAVPPGATG